MDRLTFALDRLAFLRRNLPSHGTHGEEMLNALQLIESELQSLSQEAVRDEAQIQAEALAQLLGAAILRLKELGETSWQLPPYAKALALKREPNAAGEETDSEVMSISSDMVRTPAPAVPVSETPLGQCSGPFSDAKDCPVHKGDLLAPASCGHNDRFKCVFGLPREDDGCLACALERTERQHSLAQTEIKGHMRTEDDLKARIAELEKDGARLNWLENHHTLHTQVDILYVVDGYQVTLMHEDGFTTLSPAYEGHDLRAAIDAALQDKIDK